MFAYLLKKPVKLARMVEHQLIRKTELAQVIKQQALISGSLIQLRVGGLTTTGPQQANGRRTTVCRRRVEVVENHVHLFEQ